MLNFKFSEGIKRLEIKRLWKYFVLLFLLFFLFFNYQEIFLATNYRVVWYKISNFFKISSDISLDKEVIETKPEADIQSPGQSKFKKNSIAIPRLGISAPLVLAKEDNEEDFEEVLKKGVLLYPGYAKPGEKGAVIILGHSAPEGWPDINYDNVFNNLNQLEKGDEIFVLYEQKEFRYEVLEQQIFFPEQEDKFLPKDTKESLLVLLTCWPRGKDFKRLSILAKLKD